ncbi:MAG TPA: adenylosuccinate synthase [Spirochaetia bacterium]|nr:adenylosuccinate synthase [Spirochaetia bacterium]
MAVTAVVGANWGDEGKGKITDYLAREADFVVRYQGGNNAGHTIINEYGKFALHLLPSGVFYPRVVNVLGPGVAVNVPAFLAELDKLVERGVPRPDIRISERAQALLPYHVRFDALEEERLGKESFGSTKSGIAPFYADKYLKIGLQVNELFDEPLMRSRLAKALVQKNVLLETLYGKPPLSVEEIMSQVADFRDRLAPYVADTTTLLMDAVDAGRTILLEGQLGTLRDPDHGIYPYPTSSSPLAGFGAVGAGVPPWAISRVVAVTKAYSSCVGAGPFVTELSGEEGETLRKRGGDAGEYGATTGRPRRVGWFDCVATAYGCRVQGATEAVITNLDVLGYKESIPVCTAYSIGGAASTAFPVSRLLEKATPVYQELEGWKTDIREARRFDDLPPQARDYVLFIEKRIHTPIKWISVGPRREQIITR